MGPPSGGGGQQPGGGDPRNRGGGRQSPLGRNPLLWILVIGVDPQRDTVEKLAWRSRSWAISLVDHTGAPRPGRR